MRNAPTHDGFIEADVEFHMSLARAAGNAVLLQMMSSIRSLLCDVISRGTHDPTAVASAIQHHEAILTAVRAREAALAEAAMDRHIAAVAHFIGEALGQPAIPAEVNQP
jgi:GntR family transcriptional repressor for pyruvate dehydrogenase complex